MKNILFKFYLGITVFFLCLKTNAQVKISGPTCVVPETIYQYVISGKSDSASSVQVCITAGTILNSAKGHTACTASGTAMNKVLVMWNDSASDYGTLNLTSSSGNTSITVHFTQLLLPGTIDSAVKTQMIGFNSLPATITCGPDSGGSCSPSYSYQWQQSSNRVSWSDIPFAKSSALTVDSPLKQSTYYRRKVTETGSGSIDYSDVASVFVMVQTNDDVPHTDTIKATSYESLKVWKFMKGHNWANDRIDVVLIQDLWTRISGGYRLKAKKEKTNGKA